MNTKVTDFLSCLALITLVGCTSTVELYPAIEPQIIMNAELRTSDTEHAVYISLGTSSGLSVPDDRTEVHCYINGALVASTEKIMTGSSGTPNCQIHFFHADFSSGDHVRIEAEVGDRLVYAENVFPQECRIMVDSSSVAASKGLSSQYMGERVYSFSLTIEDIPGCTTYYKALAPRYEYEFLNGEGNVADGPKQESRLDDYVFYDINEPVFDNSDSPLPEDLGFNLGVSFSVTNWYMIYTDALFADSSYSFVFPEIDQSDLASPGHTFSAKRSWVDIGVACLNADDYLQYGYFNLIYDRESHTADELIPTRSNVRGGSGYVSTLGVTMARVELKSLWSFVWLFNNGYYDQYEGGWLDEPPFEL